MELIDKDKVVAEIEKRRKSNSKNKLNLPAAFEDNYLLSFLDTIEAKEVDLDDELDFVKDAYYYFTSDERSSMKKVAKHFYELGLKAQKGMYKKRE